MNCFSNLYLQIWIVPVKAANLPKAEPKTKHWSVKWSVLIVEGVLQLENLVAKL
jgi:hypothetical protein